MSESQLWKYLKQGMEGKWDVCRIENGLQKGVPDVSFGIQGVNGWIELKYLKSFPKKEFTIIKFRHFTNHQKHWLKNRQKHGKHCWVLIQIEKEYFLYNAAYWLDRIGASNKYRLTYFATRHWSKRIDFKDLAMVLASCE